MNRTPVLPLVLFTAFAIASSAHAQNEAEVEPGAAPEPEAEPALTIAPAPPTESAQPEAAPEPAAEAPAADVPTTPAPAPQPPDDRPPPAEPEFRWYGWQTLIGDGVSAGLFLASPVAGVLSFPLLPPIVHWAHGNGTTGFASLGLRAGGILVASALTLTCVTGELFGGDGLDADGSCLIFTIGIPVAVIAALDAAFFAWDGPQAEPHDRASVGLSPLYLPHSQTAGLLIHGRLSL